VVVGALVVVGAAVVAGALVVVGATVVGAAARVAVTERGDALAMMPVPPMINVATARLPLVMIRRVRWESGRGPWEERLAARIGPMLPTATHRSG
jgi:hypothetical protein